jgi:hypothetical protein
VTSIHKGLPFGAEVGQTRNYEWMMVLEPSGNPLFAA